ncbi:hypothetical protein MTO96_002681 [Rhipicephalus appendiculatus]
MTSAVMLVVCALLFLAARSHAENATDHCKGNEPGVLLANDSCVIICNGTTSFNGTQASDGTKCILSYQNSTDANNVDAPMNKGNKTGKQGLCQNNVCKPDVATSPGNRTTGSTNGTNPNNETTSPTKAGSTTAAKPASPSATSNSSSATKPVTMQSTTRAPGSITTTPAASGHSRLAASVVSVALAIGALLCRAT